MGQAEQLRAQLIVQAGHLPDRLGGKSAQESAQGRLVGKCLQPSQRKKQTVVAQHLRFAEPWQSRNEDVEEKQNQISRVVSGPPWRRLKNPLQPPTQAQPVAKALN